MPLVDLTSTPLPNDDENADAIDIAGPISAILAVLNGHIDADNIEPGSLTTPLFANGAVGAAAQGDSGWIALTLTGDFEEYNSGSVPKYRKIGNRVEIQGAIKATVDEAVTSTTGNVFATLPAGYRPSGYNRVFMCQGTTNNRWALVINSNNGTMAAQRYGPANHVAGNWLPMSVSFLVD